MNCEFHTDADKLIAVLSGEIDHHQVAPVRESIDEKIEAQKPKELVLDFTDISFMDSSGIGVIMGRYRLVYLLGGEVWVVHANERMKKILTMSGVTRIIQIYEEEMV